MGERESKELWLNDEGVVKKVIGYTCAPMNPDYWWIPSIGVSSPNGRDTYEEALKDAVNECRSKIDSWQKKLEVLRAQRTP